MKCSYVSSYAHALKISEWSMNFQGQHRLSLKIKNFGTSIWLAKIPLPALPMDEYQIFGMIEKEKHTWNNLH